MQGDIYSHRAYTEHYGRLSLFSIMKEGDARTCLASILAKVVVVASGSKCAWKSKKETSRAQGTCPP